MSMFDRLFVRVMCAAPRSRSGERGQGLAEYALILALVAILCAAALTTLKGGITNALNSMAGAF
jgi:Flp pilus assembly pilin Flp